MKPRLATCLAVLFAGTLMPANAQPAVSPSNLKAAFAAERWQVNDITFTARTAEGTDPFAVEFGALYTGPTGEIMKVPGFYDGNDTWVSRFSSDRVGEWTFNTYSSHADLSGHSGRVTITPNTRPHQRGAVRIDPDNPQALSMRTAPPASCWPSNWIGCSRSTTPAVAICRRPDNCWITSRPTGSTMSS